MEYRYIKAYFYQKEPEFARLLEYRIRGWHENKEKGDAHFQAQRQSADASSLLGEKYFFKMMIEIAREMHEQTSVLSPNTASGKIKVLDVCMAPGGFTAAALEEHPRGELYAITLPKSMGGHQALVPMDKLRGLKELDITMLRELADGDEIPKTHPECANFRIEKPYKFHKFDLAFCDGMVLRTHKRATYREQTERLRLTTSQLIIAMTRVANGGTIALLQHKLDSWMPARIVCTFSRFSKVQVFKPQKKHASRSSFYMVAKYIDTDSEGFRECLKRLREDWWEATFGGEGGTGRCADGDDEDSVMRQINDSANTNAFRLGRPVWKIQADALAKTEYAGSE
ncbi:hypothetical protein BJ878DRAFT_412928 [Calycina marina]|uniref:Ribosomal RNA methyltransferase FtsJ domain-containing protein n=1 Tax=Calycina marina TaxID=1763456 RepID=A0A9P7ZAJ4_9HELO|nr:hypothetical protein BJ878DRAFT_412928 [Calycina marina]